MAVAAVAAGSVGLGAFGQPAGAAPLTGVVGRPVAAAAAPAHPAMWRETVRLGARDTGPYQISHVYEVQIRLARSGFFHGPVTGYFGTQTLAAVKAFQKAQRLPQTGVVEQTTWTRLISYSRLRSPGWFALPAVCRTAGWHTCYSRSTNELFLLHSGTLANTWYVRGGARGLETVLGTYTVYWKDVDHRSAEFHGAPMPYSEFFFGGEAVHGSGTMVNPLDGHSHGCINMYIEDAAEFWRLTAPFHNTVTVYGRWA